MLINKRNIVIIINLMIYKILLDVFYIEFIHKYFAYMGFLLDLNLYKYVLSVFFLIAISVAIPKNQKKPSYIFIQIHFIIMIMPMATIYAFMNMSNDFFNAVMSMFLLQCVMLRVLPEIRITRIKNAKYILYTVLGGITFFVYFSMMRSNGIPSLTALNLLQVYDVRSNVSYPFLMGYLLNWQAKIINPFLITISYLNKNKKLLSVAISLQLLLFLITAHKTFLFMPFAIIFVVKILNGYNFFKTSSKLVALVTFGMLIYYRITNLIVLPSLFVRRILFIPALIKFHYYDFFTRNEFMYFSAGVVGKILGVDYIYNLPPASMIGEIYFQSAENGANTGYIADAYANLGYIGMLIITVLFILILKLIDSLGVKVGKELTVGLTLFSILSLNDSAFLTTLLTGGLLFLLLVLYLYSDKQEQVK